MQLVIQSPNDASSYMKLAQANMRDLDDDVDLTTAMLILQGSRLVRSA